MTKKHSHEQTQSIDELMQELLGSSEDEVLNPEFPFNKVIFLEKLPDSFNKESKAAHDKFARLQGVGIPLFHHDGLLDTLLPPQSPITTRRHTCVTLRAHSFKRSRRGRGKGGRRSFVSAQHTTIQRATASPLMSEPLGIPKVFDF